MNPTITQIISRMGLTVVMLSNLNHTYYDNQGREYNREHYLNEPSRRMGLTPTPDQVREIGVLDMATLARVLDRAHKHLAWCEEHARRLQIQCRDDADAIKAVRAESPSPSPDASAGSHTPTEQQA